MITVTAAVIEFRGKILAARKRSGLHLSGFWEFPGGKVEPGESPEESLARELKEELGISCRVGTFLGESVYHYSDKSIRLLGYYATPLSTSITLTDHDEIRWLIPENLHSVDWAPADLPLVKMVLAKHLTDRTVHYYSTNAENYVHRTVGIDMGSVRRKFTRRLPDKGHILDLGCGSGRDSRAFLHQGFIVTAADASPAIAAAASKLLQQEVRVEKAQEMDESGQYDGIWACASLLHIPESEFSGTVERIIRALKPHGILYISLKKEAAGKMDDNGRFFNSFSAEDVVNTFLSRQQTELLELFETSSKLEDCQEIWLNVFMQKKPLLL